MMFLSHILGCIFDPNEKSLIFTVFHVILFWSIITLIASGFRRLLFYLNDANLDTAAEFARTSQETVYVSSQLFPSESLLNLRGFFHRLYFGQSLFLALLDAVATMEVCACSLECWPIRSAAGHTGLLVAIGMNTVRGAVFTCQDAYGNPCNPWYRFLTGHSNHVWVGITWILQLLGAQAALFLAQSWWSLRATAHHAARNEIALLMRTPSKDPAVARTLLTPDLQVSTWIGFLVEALGSLTEFYLAFVFTCCIGQWNRRCASRRTCSATRCADAKSESNETEQMVQTRGQFVTSFLVRLRINLWLTSKCLGLTGFYINPANAFVHSWGIGDVSPYAHVFVYWLGPFSGVWLSVQLEQWAARISQLLFSSHGHEPHTRLTDLSTVDNSSSTQLLPRKCSQSNIPIVFNSGGHVSTDVVNASRRRVLIERSCSLPSDSSPSCTGHICG
ncbi:hypothetical protein PHET_04128 [Paragonimus heterotremus]|uniref:Aquaporin n=1 Tax=Paragonimus heterotremus TaxID=100268 RepID=A0A8J4WJD3_9TREM|nr:hypothetical protein PHET_04128 [Paragonimus heterotremus]